MSLEIEHTEIDARTVVIRLSGRLMLGPDSTTLGALIPDLINRGWRNFIFDLSGVTHIDSTGIGHFIDAFNQLVKEKGTLRLVGASHSVRDAFHVTRLDSVFQFFPTVDAAQEGLARN